MSEPVTKVVIQVTTYSKTTPWYLSRNGSRWNRFTRDLQQADRYDSEAAALRALVNYPTQHEPFDGTIALRKVRCSQRIMPAGVKQITTQVVGETDTYTVRIRDTGETCTCKDYIYRRMENHGRCKHISQVLEGLRFSTDEKWYLL